MESINATAAATLPPWLINESHADLSPSWGLTYTATALLDASGEEHPAHAVKGGSAAPPAHLFAPDATDLIVDRHAGSSALGGKFYDRLLEGYGLEFLPQHNGWVDGKTLVALPMVYLAIISLLGRWMTDRKPFQLKAAMRVYNVTQVVLCSYMAVGLLFSPLLDAPSLPRFLGLIPIPNFCAIAAPYTSHAEWYILVHYLSKFLDLFDTVFIILRKKDEQLSFLHVYHHASIGVVWGIVLRTGNGSGTAAYGAWVNSVIHVLMYSHYFVTSFGINNPLKKWLTASQICQFYSCVAHALLVSYYIGVGWEASVPKQLAALQVCYHMSMITLFSAFYKRKFSKTKRKIK